MKNSLICLSLSVLSLIINTGCEQKTLTDSPVTIKTIEASVASVGGRATVEKYLFDTSEVHQPALAQIESGNKEWVALGVKMLQYSDAGSTGGLLSALGRGMQQQPENVLPYLNQPIARPTVDGTGVATQLLLTPEKICLPFISNELPLTDQLAIVQRTNKALLTVRNPALYAQCKSCLREAVAAGRTLKIAMAKGAD